MGERGRESFDGVPVVLFRQRNRDMKAFAAGAFEHWLQALALQSLSQVLCRKLNGLEGHVRRRVEIEDEPIRVVDIIDTGAPGVDFNRTHLDNFEQALFVFDVEILETLALVPEWEGLHVRAETPSRIPLVKALFADTSRTSQKA